MANLAVDLPLAIARGTNRSTGTVSYRSEPGSQAGSPLGVVVATGFLAWRPDHRLSLLLYPKRKIEVLIHMRLQAFVANIFSVCSVSPWWIVFPGILNTETRSSRSLHGEIRLLRQTPKARCERD